MILVVEILFITLLASVFYMLYKNENLFSKKQVPCARIEELWDGVERRRYTRFKKALDVTYAVRNKPHLKNGATLDISEGGAKLLLEEKLSNGIIVSLVIAIPNQKTRAEVEGTVVWSDEAREKNPGGKRTFHAGVKFLALKEPVRSSFLEYVRSLASDPEG